TANTTSGSASAAGRNAASGFFLGRNARRSCHTRCPSYGTRSAGKYVARLPVEQNPRCRKARHFAQNSRDKAKIDGPRRIAQSPRAPVCSATVPPVHTAASTFFNPTPRISSHSSSGRKNLATDDGKYLYAAASPEITPPTFGRIFLKYHR